MNKYQNIATLLLRLATAANFLSPVASRFGWWGENGSNWNSFLAYAAEVNSYASPSAIPFLAITATGLEIILSFMLLIGLYTRWAALGAAALTLLFGLAMTYSFGIKSPLDYAVFVDCTSALLLATVSTYRWSLDNWLANRRVFRRSNHYSPPNSYLSGSDEQGIQATH